MKIFKILTLILMISNSAWSQQADPTPYIYTFRNDIAKIFEKNCTACHNAESAANGGLPNWLDYDTAFSKKDRIRYRVAIKRNMPQGAQMDEQERQAVRLWVEQGALP